MIPVKTETPKQVGKFTSVGILNTVIDIAILNILVFFGLKAVLTIGQNQYPVANIIAVSCAMVNSFIWNRRWTFGSKEKAVLPQVIKFLLITLIASYLIQQIVLSQLYYRFDLLDKFAEILAGIIPKTQDFFKLNISKAFAVLGAGIWNFLGYKFFVFRKRVSSA